jgi:hypothetical protein
MDATVVDANLNKRIRAIFWLPIFLSFYYPCVVKTRSVTLSGSPKTMRRIRCDSTFEKTREGTPQRLDFAALNNPLSYKKKEYTENLSEKVVFEGIL